MLSTCNYLEVEVAILILDYELQFLHGLEVPIRSNLLNLPESLP